VISNKKNLNQSMKSLFARTVTCCLLFVLNATAGLSAQTITLAEGSDLPRKYCRVDQNYALAGSPTGGVFSGCGVYEENGQWYFNPMVATQGATVFPVVCNLTYTAGGNSSMVPLMIWKPVVIIPPLEDSSTCSGYFNLHATTLYAGAYDYKWTPAPPLDFPDSPGTAGFITSTQEFVLTAVDLVSGCMGSDTVIIERNPEPKITTSNDTTINARGAVQLHASGAQTYSWFPRRWLNNDAIADPIAYPQAPVIYQVIGINEFGCRDTAEVKIDIREHLFVPNAFSPNGDGLNDVFKLGNYGHQGVHAFMIFNRFGEKVYQTMDATKGWDGTYKGQPADAGTYYYDIRIGLFNGTERVLKGDIILMR
jgi:gliding motility-associated-like protein